MIENVTIIDRNGNTIIVEGLSYIKLLENNKKYVFYTLNEIVENNLTKMYVAEVSEAGGIANPINDEEWNTLRNILVRFLRGEGDVPVEHYPMQNISFNIGEPRKIAVKEHIKDAIKDKQIKSTSMANSIVNMMGEESIINDDAVDVEQAEQNNEPVNIFETPAKPNDYIENNSQIINSSEFVQESIQPQLNEEYAIDLNNQQEDIASQNILQDENQTIELAEPDIILQENKINENNQEETITKEDVLHALEILNKYFYNTKEFPTSFLNETVYENNYKNAEPTYINTDAKSLSANSLENSTTQNADIVENNIAFPYQETMNPQNEAIIHLEELVDLVDSASLKTDENKDEYVANGTSAFAQIDTSSEPPQIPVVMPDGYEKAKTIDTSNGMGPSSLNADGGPLLGLQNNG